MRLILAIGAFTAAALAAIALPAQAQRLDARVRQVETTANGGLTCHGNANRGLLIDHDADGRNASALLFQPPVEEDPAVEVTLAIPFTPHPGEGYGAQALPMGLQLVPVQSPFPYAVTGGRLVIDGKDVGVALRVQNNPDLPSAVYLTVPTELRAGVGDQVVAGRWIEFQVIGRKGEVVRSYRFDGARIHDATETLSIIKWSCRGARAD